MSEERRFVWEQYRQVTADHERHRLLVIARKATATPPGSVVEVWPLYTSTAQAAIAAEHVTIGIWGTHQQGAPKSVHVATTAENPWPLNFGGACRSLFDIQFSTDPQVRSPIDTMANDTISKRLAVLSRTDEVDIAAAHITSLVRLMRSTGTHIGFHYDDLYWALRNWASPDKRTSTMHHWSRSYFRAKTPPSPASTAAEG